MIFHVKNVCPIKRDGDLVREMKAAYSILWVEPGGVNLLGVSSTKIKCGLDRVLFSFSWMSFSRNVICWSVFLRCLYQPITLSCNSEAQNISVSAEAQTYLHVKHAVKFFCFFLNWFKPVYFLPGFSLQCPHSHLRHCCRSYKHRNQDKKNNQLTTAGISNDVIFDRSDWAWQQIRHISFPVCSTHMFSLWQGTCFCISVKEIKIDYHAEVVMYCWAFPGVTHCIFPQYECDQPESHWWWPALQICSHQWWNLPAKSWDRTKACDYKEDVTIIVLDLWCNTDSGLFTISGSYLTTKWSIYWHQQTFKHLIFME